GRTGAGRRETAEVPTAPEEPVEPPEVPAEPSVPAARALAKPPVRKLAKDLGISLAALAGSGPDGSITRDDVQRAAETGTPARSGYSGNGSRTAAAGTAARGGGGVPGPRGRQDQGAAPGARPLPAPPRTAAPP